MTKPAVYLETSVISYAASRPSRDLIVAARQQVTRDWFDHEASKYDVVVSRLVAREASAGDPEAANRRRDRLSGIPLLEITTEVERLVDTLLNAEVVPRTSVEDAFHIAVAAVHGVDYLLTWNFAHIANATLRHAIEDECRNAGFEPPVICTPEELTDGNQGR